MRPFHVITTLLFLMAVGLTWGNFADGFGIPYFLSAPVSFSIGFFGFQPVYNWLTKSNEVQDEE